MVAAYGSVASFIAFWPHLPQRFGYVRLVIFPRSLNLGMSVHDLHPGVLRVVIEKADLDEQAIREQARNRDHGPIPEIAIIGRPIRVGLKPIWTCLPPFVQPPAAADKIANEPAYAFRRQSLQVGVA